MKSIMAPPSLESDLKQAAIHEAAHLVVARHFGITGEATLWQARRRPTYAKKTFLGNFFHCQLNTPFRRAVIGWAGPLADDFEDASMDVEAWWMNRIEDIKAGDECYSATDRTSMLCHPQVWRTCKTSHGILLKRYKEWEQAARRLIYECAPRRFQGFAKAKLLVQKEKLVFGTIWPDRCEHPLQSE